MAVKVKLNPNLLSRVARGAVMPTIDAIARLARNEIIDVMEESDPSGRTYTLPSGERRRASRRGQPPAIGEGEYRDAWAVAPARIIGRRRIVAQVYNPIVLGAKRTPMWAALNYGRNRPHVEPALTRVAARARRLLRKR